MPILDIERVLPDAAPAATPGLAQALADAAGRVFGNTPGRTWVRLRTLPAADYAENDVAPLGSDALPVFVTVLHARAPEGQALSAQVSALTHALAGALGCDAQRVHVLVAADGAGRQAFSGRLVR